MTETTKHKGLYAALAAAQGEMGRALKDTNNPHFKSKYADLSSVCDACMPALSKHGIAVLQPAFDDETGRYVKTIFVHGETGETAECRVPLIVAKNDMQGYGSAVTYARRYGLMGMAGIAPEDDDGNAAAKAPPLKDELAPMPTLITADQFFVLRNKAELANVEESKIAVMAGIDDLRQLPAAMFEGAMKKLQVTIDRQPKPNADLGGNEIPYEGPAK